MPYYSGPQWLAENVLRDKWVLAVSGTHGKTTTTSMLAWILEYAGLDPGFLIGGVPSNFGVSARLGGVEVLRRRGGRVRHRVLRQAREVRPLPAAHARDQQHRVRPRRHLRGRRRDPLAVPPARAHRAGQRLDRRERPRPERRQAPRARHLDAGRDLQCAATPQSTGPPRTTRSARRRASPCGGAARRSAACCGRCSARTTSRTRSRRPRPPCTSACRRTSCSRRSPSSRA